MRYITEDQMRSIQHNPFRELRILNFVCDLALVSHTHQHMQENSTRVNDFSLQTGMKIGRKKTEVESKSFSTSSPIEMNGVNLPITEVFTYQGSIDE